MIYRDAAASKSETPKNGVASATGICSTGSDGGVAILFIISLISSSVLQSESASNRTLSFNSLYIFFNTLVCHLQKSLPMK